MGVASLDTLGGGEVTYQVLASSCKGVGGVGVQNLLPITLSQVESMTSQILP